MSDYSSDEDTCCPICCEDLDITDKHFQPCPCGFKICSWCWNKIEQTTQRCPACRRQYDRSNIEFTPPDPELIQQEKKQKEKKKKPHINRKQLANVRVIQRNLVYVVGLTLLVAKHDWLKHTDNFAKYGKIKKVVINKSNLHNSTHVATNRTPTVSAYITYMRKEDAYKAIRAVDKTYLDGKQLRASFGTTKYCAYFLKGIPCTNPDCMYLHEYGNDEDTFNKDEIVLRNGLPVPHNLEKMSQFYPPDDDSQPVDKHFWKYPNSNKEPEDGGSDDESTSSAGGNGRLRHYDISDDENIIDDDEIQEEDDYYSEEPTPTGTGAQRSLRAAGSSSRGRRDDNYNHTIDDYFDGGDEEVESEESDDHEVQTGYAIISKADTSTSKGASILPQTARWGQQATPVPATTNTNTNGTSAIASPVNLPTNITKSKKKNKNKNKNKKNKNKKTTKTKDESDNASSNPTHANAETVSSSGRSSTEPSNEDETVDSQEQLAMSVIDNIQLNEDPIITKSEEEILNDVSLLESHQTSTLGLLGIEPNPSVESTKNTENKSKFLSLLEPNNSNMNAFSNFGGPTDPMHAFSNSSHLHQPMPQQNQFFAYPQQVQHLFASFQGFDPYHQQQQYMDAWNMNVYNNANADTKRTSSRFFGGSGQSQEAQQVQQPQQAPQQGNEQMWNMQSTLYQQGNQQANQQQTNQQANQTGGQQTSRFFNIKNTQTENSNPQQFGNADLQNSFRALLPNVNITFAAQSNEQTSDWTNSGAVQQGLYPNHYAGFFTQGYQQTNQTWSWK